MEAPRQETGANFEKSELTRLTSEEYFREQEEIFDLIKSHNDTLQSSFELWTYANSIAASIMEGKSEPPETILERMKSKARSLDLNMIKEAYDEVYRRVGGFCSKYDLDFIAFRGMYADAIERGIVQAYEAKLWNLTRDLRE